MRILLAIIAAVLIMALPEAAMADGRMNAGGQLLQGGSASLSSPSGRVTLVIQNDCNLVASSGQKHDLLWASGTQGNGVSCTARMQTDGNFVVYGRGNNALWSSNTQGHPGAYLLVQDDGNIIVDDNAGHVLWASGSSAHGEWVNCVTQPNANPATRVCYIFEPNVQQPVTDYKQITFNAGDTIQIAAQGCVQTGGSGKTWKDYVNPRGDNAPRLYQGQIKIPGVIPSLAPLSSFNGKTVEFPPNVDSHIAFLTLGYTDDGYGDNGYYKHDDGDDDQCKNKGPASLVLTITTQGQTFNISPKFQVLTVIYAPPGCSNNSTYKCSGSGSADYGQGSSTGTKVATGDSYKAGVTVTASVGVPTVASLSGSGGFAVTATDSNSETITKTASNDIKVQGNKDGVDHDQDQIILLLNPDVAIRAASNSVQWSEGYRGTSAVIKGYSVDELKHRPKLPCNVSDPPVQDQMSCANAKQLSALGFNDTDFKVILQQDPFANGAPGNLAPRFVPTTTSFGYGADVLGAQCNNGQCNCTTFTGSIKNAVDTEAVVGLSTDVTVGLEASGGIGILSLKASDSFTWTNSSTNTYTKDGNQSATFTITCASPTYQSSDVFMGVYWDTIYSSFLFVPESLTSDGTLTSGTVRDKSGQLVVGREIELVLPNGKTYYTFTNRAGLYRFPVPKSGNARSGSGELRVENVRRSIPLVNAPKQAMDLQLQ